MPTYTLERNGVKRKVSSDEPLTEEDIDEIALELFGPADPTLGQIGKGLAAEVAIAEGAKYGGAAAGGAIGATLGTAIPFPVVGTVAGAGLGAGIGYAVGAISGGVTGSIAAQEIENPGGDINWGRVVGDTFLNFIPGSKFTKGGKFLTTAKRAAAANIAANAAIGGASIPVAQLIEGSIEGKLPTQEELVKGGATGFVLGGALGASGEALAKSYAKFAGKNVDVLTDAYNKGDQDAKNVVDPLLEASNLGTGKAPGVITNSKIPGVPDAKNAQKTQVATTTQTYVKSEEILNEFGGGKTLDFGAGRLKGAKAIGADSYEPYPKKGVKPTYTKSEDIPSESYEKIISPSVLNVVPRDIRDSIVTEIARILKPGGNAAITTRTVSDVAKAKFKEPHPSEQNAFIIGKDKSEATYQKGFTDSELRNYLQETLGENFDVLPLPRGKDGKKVNGATALIRKKKSTINLEADPIKAEEKIVSQVATHALAKDNPLENFPKSAKGLSGVLKRTKARLAPRLTIGRELDLKLENIRQEADGLESLGDKIRTRIQNRVKNNPALNDNISKFMIKKAELDPELSDVLPDLEKFRDEMVPVQEEISQFLDEGYYNNLTKEERERLSDTIRASIEQGIYKKTEYRIFTDKNFVPSDAQRAKAQEEIADSIIEGNLAEISRAKEKGLELPARISKKEALEKANVHLKSLKEKSARQRDSNQKADNNVQTSYVPMSIQGSLRRKKDVGEEEAKYLGLIEDSGEQIFGTLRGIARLRQAAKEDKAIIDIVESSGIGVRLRPEEDIPDDLTKIPFKTVQDVDIYVPNEFHAALNRVRSIANHQKGMFSKLYDPAAGAIKVSNIFLSPILYATQLVSGMGLTAATGILPTGRYLKNVGRGVQMVAGDMKTLSKIPGVQRVLGDRRRFLDDYQDAVSLNIIGKDILASDIRSTFEGTSPLLDKVITKFGKVYSAFDTVYRYALWKTNQDTITKMFPGIDEKTAKIAAANLTNDTFPNYDKVAGAAKYAAKKAIINPYSSFSLEMFRNTFHLAKYADQMAKGEFGKNLGVDPSKLPPADQAFMRREGLKRLGALAGVVGLAPAATEQVVKMFGGDQNVVIESDKEKRAVEETIANSWDRGKTLVSVRKPNGDIITVDPSYIIPHAIINDGFKAGLSGDPNAISKYILNLFGTDGGLVAGPLFRVINNQDSFSNVLEYQEDLGAEERAMYLFRELFRPPGINEAQKWNDALKKEGKYDVGDLTRRAFGIRLTVLDPKQQAKFNIKDSVDNLSGTKRQFYSDSEKLEGAELQAAYQRANAQAKQSYDKIARHYKNLQTLGFSQKEIYDIMKKEANVSAMDLLRISSGLSYKPFAVAKVKSTRDLYEELDPEISKEAAIKLIEDPDQRKRLENYQKEQDFIDKKNISISERSLMGLTNAEKVSWLKEINASRKQIINLKNRKIISGQVRNEALRNLN